MYYVLCIISYTYKDKSFTIYTSIKIMKIVKCVTEKLINIIKTYSKEDKKILGRWNIESCSKKLDTKIDLANEDHCGPCGLYIKNKLKNK